MRCTCPRIPSPAGAESIDSNIAAAAAAAARREGQTAEDLHASDYEIYAYLQTGQDKAARRIVESLPEIASRFDPKAVLNGSAGPSVGYFALAAIPARYALEHRDWKQAAQLALRETPFPYTDAMTWLARGLGATRTCAGSERVSGSARADPRAAFKSRRKLLGAAGGDTGGYARLRNLVSGRILSTTTADPPRAQSKAHL
jgi:hypothetical protein